MRQILEKWEEQRNRLNPLLSLLSFNRVYSKPLNALYSHWRAFSLVSLAMCLPSCCCISLSSPHEALQHCGGNFLCIPRLLTLRCDVQSFANTPRVYEILFQGDAVTPTFCTDASNGTRCRAQSSVPQIYAHSRGQDTAWEETGRGWTVPSLCGELLQSRGTEGCDVLHRDCSAPRSQGRTSFPFQAELSPGLSKDTRWQSQLLGAKPPVPSAHQMDAHVPERAAVTSPASLPLRESNVVLNCAMLQSRDCLRPHLSPPPARTARLPARTPRVSDTG